MNKIYYIDIKKLQASFTYEELYNMVSLYRKNKVNRLKLDKDKWLSLGVEYLLINGLKELNIDYSMIEIEHIENNKPVFKNCPDELYFNLSHSGEMAMCIISDYEVGCDIQEKLEKENYLEIAKKFFHPKEFEIIQNAKNEEKLDYFYRIWVLKESYIKNTGRGLGTPLNQFRISLDNNHKLYINEILNNDYYFEEKETGDPNYKSAFCIKLK